MALPFVVWTILMSRDLDWSSYTGEPLTDAEQRAFDAKDRAAVIATAAGPAAIPVHRHRAVPEDRRRLHMCQQVVRGGVAGTWGLLQMGNVGK